jgi:CBS-domain-containing membrane protein
MTRDVVTVTEDTDLGEVAELLEAKRIKRVPVTRDGKVIGIISRFLGSLLKPRTHLPPRIPLGRSGSCAVITSRLRRWALTS